MEQETKTTEKSFFKKNRKEILSWIILIAVAVGLAFFINNVIIINSYVPSGSMESTIMTGSRIIGLRASYWTNDPERGDIVIFKYPDDPSVNYVKRVAGLPGDTIQIIDGTTYVNGEKLEEPFLNETPLEYDFGPYEVPEGHYFMLGDNRNNSSDSRFWANTYVPREYVLGKVIFCYWPLNLFGAVN